VQAGKIIPYHLQLIPTNRCNANCPWCSCRKDNRNIELGTEEILDILKYFANLGTKAITITGGGEPTIHPDINSIIDVCSDYGIKTGLVTNGIEWSRKGLQVPQNLTWLRASVFNTEQVYDVNILRRLFGKIPNVDCGISFTVTQDVNIDIAMNVCYIAEEFDNVTHVRFVSDVFNAHLLPMERVKLYCQDITPKAFFAARKVYTEGMNPCYVSLLKPLIGADGYVYPCCGIQYAFRDTTHKLPEKARMCRWYDFETVMPFNGSKCVKCFYNQYNEVLYYRTKEIVHGDFL
jgi:hypothetical protein